MLLHAEGQMSAFRESLNGQCRQGPSDHVSLHRVSSEQRVQLYRSYGRAESLDMSYPCCLINPFQFSSVRGKNVSFLVCGI